MVARIHSHRKKPVQIFFREWREWRGLTQEQLAERIGTTKATVSRIENGTRDWGKGYLEACAYAVSCEPIDLISRPPDAPRSLDEMLRDAPPHIRNQVRAVVETLIKTGT